MHLLAVQYLSRKYKIYTIGKFFLFTAPNNLKWKEEAPGRQKVLQKGNRCPD